MHITLSSSPIVKAPIISPFSSTLPKILCPPVPRPCALNSVNSTRFPIPFSVTTKIFEDSSTWIAAQISSPAESFIPITPRPVLPIERTSSSEILSACPRRVTKSSSSFPVESIALTSLSPSFNPAACIPFVFAFLNSYVGVFFTTPPAVAMNRYWVSENSFMFTTVVISSFAFTASRLLMWDPRLVLLASGISWTFIQYAFPSFVMNMR